MLIHGILKNILYLLNKNDLITVKHSKGSACKVYTLSKKADKDQESIKSRTTPDPGYQWESDNVTNRHHKREQKRSALSQQVTTRHQQTDVHESITKQDRNNINDPQRSTALERSVKNILLEGLNRFNGPPTSPLVQMWIKTHRCLVCMKDP